MPDNPVSGKAGNLTRCEQVLDFLSENSTKNKIDFLSIKDWSDWSPEATNNFKKRFPRVNLKLITRKYNDESLIKRILLYKIPNVFFKIFKETTVDITNPFLNFKISKFINNNHYDYIIVSYSSWGKIIRNIKYTPYLILDTHDFVTAQHYKRNKSIGKLFQSELNILRKFNEIWTFSIEEKYLYEQFTNAKVVHMPIAFNQKKLYPLKHKKYDVIYIASENPHNVKGIHWFLENVLPILNENITIHIIGKIGKVIKKKYPNVIIHGMVDDLQEFYDNARITICPMLSGTGVKIKVLESLSNNLPVVTNTRGVDGLSQKNDNGCLVTDDAGEFAKYIETLITDDELYDKLRHKAYSFIKNNHSLEKEKIFFKNKFS